MSYKIKFGDQCWFGDLGSRRYGYQLISLLRDRRQQWSRLDCEWELTFYAMIIKKKTLTSNLISIMLYDS